MLKRKIDDFLLRWKENRKQALLITGARQMKWTPLIGPIRGVHYKFSSD